MRDNTIEDFELSSQIKRSKSSYCVELRQYGDQVEQKRSIFQQVLDIDWINQQCQKEDPKGKFEDHQINILLQGNQLEGNLPKIIQEKKEKKEQNVTKVPEEEGKSDFELQKRKEPKKNLNKKKHEKQKKKEKDESQWLEEQEEESVQEKKKKSTTQTKNLLINFRKPIIKYLRRTFHEQEEDEYLKHFEKTQVCLGHYEDLFKKKEFKEALKKMFRERYLNRQIINSRVDRKLLPIYQKKIKVMHKAFLLQRFPRIN